MFIRKKFILSFLILFFGFNSLKLLALEDLLFKPLTANHLESRIGTFYQIEDDKLRLDIGHSLDFKELISNENLKLRIGGDFFILSRLRSEGKMKFPVETSDFYFGLNGSANFRFLENNFSARLRIAHISSHLVDGFTKNNYEFIQEPFVYSREFIDLILSSNHSISENFSVRPYFGGTFIFSTIPKNVNKIVPQIGFDFEFSANNLLKLSGGYDFKLQGTENLANIGCNSLQTGIQFNLSQNIGIALNYYYYSGYSIHGMFHTQKDNYNGFGIQINY
jgi:hypothetical protein